MASMFNTTAGQQLQAGLFMDKEGILQWDGTPAAWLEYRERTDLMYYGIIREDEDKQEARRKSVLTKIKNGLRGDAWTKRSKEEAISVKKLTTGNADDNYETMMTTIKEKTQKVAPLMKMDQFIQYFFKGNRRPGESVDLYIKRRESELQVMLDANKETNLSADIQAFFLLFRASLQKELRENIQFRAGEEFDLEKTESAMRFHCATVHETEGKGGLNKFKKKFAAKIAAVLSGSESEASDNEALKVGSADSDSESDTDLSEPLEEFACFLAEAVIEPLLSENDDTTQKVVEFSQEVLYQANKSKNTFKGAKQAKKDQRKQRGFDFNSEGKISFAPELDKKLVSLKSKTRCHDCGQVGHWKGDKECPGKSSKSSGSKSGGGGGNKGYKGFTFYDVTVSLRV